MTENTDSTNNQLLKAYSMAVNLLRPRLKRIWEARKQLLIINGAVAVLTILILVLIIRPSYTSNISILPDYGASAASSSLSGIASLVTGATGATPTGIYQNLLTNETVIGPVLLKKRKTNAFKDSVTLIEYFGFSSINPSLPEETRQRLQFLKAFNKFQDNVLLTNIDVLTNILKVSITLPESQLSADVVNDVVRSLETYVLTKRQSNARSQKLYLEKRLIEVTDSLTAAENQLKFFQLQNRVIDQSPELLLEQARLQRNIDLMQAVFSQLTQQLEQAKLDEIRDTPILNVSEYAKDPGTKVRPAKNRLHCVDRFYYSFADMRFSCTAT